MSKQEYGSTYCLSFRLVSCMNLSLQKILPKNTTLLISSERHKLLRHLPRGLKVAEIGVYKGKFSRKILYKTRPKVLSLVDAWDIDVERGHIPHREQHEDVVFSALARSLPRKLKVYSPFSRINVHQGLSVPMADSFTEKSLDWIYVDADHSYEGVLGDLEAWSSKVKDDGLIFGHDFTNQPSAIADGFGVIEAVRDFTKKHDYHLLLITKDYFPTFVLCKNLEGLAADFMSSIIRTQKSINRIDTDQVFKVSHNRYERNGGKTGLLCDYGTGS